MLCDIGLNLTNKRFNKDWADVVDRALEAGVSTMIVTGTSVSASTSAVALAKQRPGVLYATAGVHPHDAKSMDAATLPTLRRLAQDAAVVAIGECGLDYNRDFSPRDVQGRCFDAQLGLAVELGLPVFMHERDAHGAFVEILTPHLGGLTGGVVHCFTGTTDALRAYLDLGLYIGITGWICDERRGLELRDAVRFIPMDRLLVETDAPYLTPRDLRPKPKGGRNEPAFLPHILATVAQCMGVTEDTLAAATAENSRRCFGID